MPRLKDNEKRMFDFFMLQNTFCWACGAAAGLRWSQYTAGLEYPRDLHNHHIVGGSGRVHERWNISRLCKLCHDLYHGANVVLDLSGNRKDRILPALSFENVCWLKRKFDPDWWEPAKLQELRLGSFQPIEPERPAKWFQDEFHKRRGKQ